MWYVIGEVTADKSGVGNDIREAGTDSYRSGNSKGESGHGQS